MISGSLFVLTVSAALSAAAAAGMMYVFSTFVMRGLDRTGPVAAITAMRGINAAANTNAAFLIAYFGAAVLSVVTGVMAVLRLGEPGSVWALVGAAFGVLGAVVTVVCNVPLNNRLDSVDPAGLSASEAARYWQSYLSTWTAWNHVRASSGVVAAVLLAIALGYR